MLPAPDWVKDTTLQLLAQQEVNLNEVLGAFQEDPQAWFEVTASVDYLLVVNVRDHRKRPAKGRKVVYAHKNIPQHKNMHVTIKPAVQKTAVSNANKMANQLVQHWGPAPVSKLPKPRTYESHIPRKSAVRLSSKEGAQRLFSCQQ